MALTGFSFVCFVTGHTAGNLTAYMGHWDGGAMMNEYAAFLQGFAHGAGIWVARAGLLGLLFIHVTVAAWLTLDSWTARRKGYKKRKLEATWQSRTMRYTAVILIAFVAYHLLHMTLGWAPIHRHFEHGNAYSNFVNGFSDPLTSGIYIIANLCLFLHLWHGIWSFSQTLGLSHPRYEKLRKYAAGLWAFGVAGINISFPIAVLTGFLR
jgi:succinate dehydrogenase / fumarate reductase cytochrome b subunit